MFTSQEGIFTFVFNQLLFLSNTWEESMVSLDILNVRENNPMIDL